MSDTVSLFNRGPARGIQRELFEDAEQAGRDLRLSENVADFLQ
jgi:hypothetical protein